MERLLHLAVFLLLHTFLPLCLAQQGHCLPEEERVPESQLRNLTFPNGESVPVGLAFAAEHGSWLISVIAGIILEEKLGYNTVKQRFQAQSELYFRTAGCQCENSCAVPNCSNVPATPTLQFLMLGWELPLESRIQTMEMVNRELVLDQIGSQGYRAFYGVHIPEIVRSAAEEEMGLHLEFYKAYRDANASQFFDELESVNVAPLRHCNQTNIQRPEVLEALSSIFGQEALGAVILPNGQWHLPCYKGVWWLAPACRDNPNSCIPLLTSGRGQGFSEVASKALAYNLPIAFGSMTRYLIYLGVPRRRLYFGWYPAVEMRVQNGTAIVFPPFDSYQWSQGDQRTAGVDQLILTFANNKVSLSPEGRFLKNFLGNAKFGKGQLDQTVEAYWVASQSSTETSEELFNRVGCDWIHENRAVWEAWIPTRTLCDLGSGLIANAANRLSYVTNESLATECAFCSSGRYSSPVFLSDGAKSHVCLECPVGQEQATSAEASCTLCPVGKHKSQVGTEACEDCPRGKHQNTTGQSVCNDCPAGKITDTAGEEECQDCPLGEHSIATAQTGCTLCPAGKFTNQTGTSDCILCSAVLPGSSGPRAASSSAECACPAGFFLNESYGCLACPEGLSCAGGRSTPEQQAGFWVDVGAVEAFNKQNYIVYLCRTASECPAGLMGTCASGREGVACNNCKDFHYPADAGVCAPCEGASLAPTVVAVILAPLLFIAIVMVVRLDASRQHLTIVTAGAVAGQVVNLVQLLAAAGQISVTMPQPLSGLLELLGPLVLDLDVLRLSCMLGADNPVVNFVLQLLVYPCFLTMLLLSLAISRLIKRPLSPMVLFNLNGTLLFTVYISMALAMMIPFQCRSNPGGFSSMATDPGLKCFDDAQHMTLAGLAVFGILVYPVGIAAWLAYVTFKFKTWLQSAKGIRRLTHYRFMFGRFDPQSYFFGIIYLGRNLVLAALPVYLFQFPTLQILGMLAVLVLGSVIQASIWPWRTDAANQCDRVLGIILVLLVGGIGTIIKGDSKEVEQAMSITLTVMVIGAFVGALSMLGFSLYRRYRGSKQFDFFLCHHKAGAGSLCRLLKMMVETSSSANVFIDSDHLNNLDLLFDTVRGQVGHLIVVLTQSVLSRHWCAGEIVTAHRNRVHMVPLVCDDFVRPGTKQIEEIIDNWTGDEVGTLGTFDISVAAIKEAYMHLLGLPMLHLPLHQGLVKKEAALIEVMTACFAIPIYRKCMHEDNARTPAIVVAGGKDSEALAACEIMQVLLQGRLEVEVSVVHSEEEARTFAPHARIFLTLFSRGLLHDPAFGKIAYATFSHPAGSPQLLTAVADGGFQFPPTEFVQEVEAAGLGVPGLQKEQGPGLAKIYQTMLSVLARPFTPLASKGAIEEQVRELCGRARPMLEKKADRVIPAVEFSVPHSSNWSKGKLDRSDPGTPVGGVGSARQADI